jgi:hypothetical protein
MSKRKRARLPKPRSVAKNRSKAATRKRAAPCYRTGTTSKQERVLALLRRPTGALLTFTAPLGSPSRGAVIANRVRPFSSFCRRAKSDSELRGSDCNE